jgi:putative zinc finger/helix-turn-helix YgiT family protein
MMKPFPWKCGDCHERAVRPKIIPSYDAELEHDGKKYRVSIPDFQVALCEKCGRGMVFDDAANRRLSDALRGAVGLLSPEEIRARREGLRLTQKELAACLHIAEATLSRWETGAQIQQRAMDAFLRVFFESPEARRVLAAREKPADRSTRHLTPPTGNVTAQGTRRASTR